MLPRRLGRRSRDAPTEHDPGRHEITVNSAGRASELCTSQQTIGRSSRLRQADYLDCKQVRSRVLVKLHRKHEIGVRMSGASHTNLSWPSSGLALERIECGLSRASHGALGRHSVSLASDHRSEEALAACGEAVRRCVKKRSAAHPASESALESALDPAETGRSRDANILRERGSSVKSPLSRSSGSTSRSSRAYRSSSRTCANRHTEPPGRLRNAGYVLRRAHCGQFIVPASSPVATLRYLPESFQPMGLPLPSTLKQRSWTSVLTTPAA